MSWKGETKGEREGKWRERKREGEEGRMEEEGGGKGRQGEEEGGRNEGKGL